MNIPKTHILSNNKGSYYFWANSPYSKFCGCYFFDGKDMIKCIEDIYVNDKFISSKSDEKIINVERENSNQEIYMHKDENSVAYSFTNKKEITLLLDVRRINDLSVWGRNYLVEERDEGFSIRFCKDDLEPHYMYIKFDGQEKEIINNFEERNYKYDSRRKSESKRFVFRAIKISTGFLTIGFGKSEDEAYSLASSLYQNYDHLKIEDRVGELIDLPKLPDMLKKPFNDLQVQMEHLISKRGIAAGYPWFFQVWSRDEMISSIYLMLKKDIPRTKNMFTKYLKEDYIKGFPAILPNEGIPSADGSGWFFKRFYDFISLLFSEGKINEVYNDAEMKDIIDFLVRRADYVLEHNMKEGLVYSGPNETWMDTSFNDNGREGFCIEIQALTAKMLDVVFLLSGEKKYKTAEKELREKTRDMFFVNETAFDHLNVNFEGDVRKRPNIFIAYYVYPKLFERDEWELIFDSHIEDLWLEWGGFASLEKKDSNFVSTYSGEGNESYHRGDSWYFLNCMAAMSFIDIDEKKYEKYIVGILDSCVTDVAKEGVIGGLAEVSSAEKRTSYGCLSQAWSNALFIELLSKLF